MLGSLSEFNFGSVCFRLVLAVVSGGMIGFGRARKKQPAGLRTYIITCVGAALTALISYYEYEMLTGAWSAEAATAVKFDGSRFAAAVISGIGFLAAGSIMLVAHQQVSGLTTAIGLFVTACIGIAAGIGFYEAVFAAVIFIIVVMEGMQSFELLFKRRTRNMTIHVNFDDLKNLNTITDALKSEGVTVYEIDNEEISGKKTTPSTILWVKLSKDNVSHSSVLSSVAELPCVYSVQELIS